jgi:cytochrome b6-f complex iron-sulfur subunit
MDQVEAVDRYVESLLAGEKPAPARGLSEGPPETLRMAALLASAESYQSQPSVAFVERLRERFQGAQRGWFSRRLSRRGLARGLAGGVAAVTVCLFGEQALQRVMGPQVPAGWVPVAKASELPPGTVKRFVAGDVDGNLMNIGGRIWALSAVCTHQACLLDWSRERQEFVCGCHGAEFDTAGQQLNVDEYQTPLAPLARIPVQQLDGTIYVVTA